jgi:NADPH-dependent 2,4-dienoyl-CoA reductase/sulfur reductase-like enzyme
MIQRDYLIIGGGIAAGAAVETLRKFDKRGSVTLVTSEPYPPYRRPSMLTAVLEKGNGSVEGLSLQPLAWYAKNKIELRLDMPVTQLNLDRHLAVLATGQVIEFKKAILAMGSRPRRPAVAGAGLGHVLYIRSIRDVQALKEASLAAPNVVVIGGGLIAAETVSLLRHLKVNVTLMCRYANLWQNRLDSDTAHWITGQFASRGVDLMMGESLNGFEGKTVLRNIQTKSGNRFPAGVALVAIGADPNLDLVANTPLSSPNGTPVNELLESDEKGIYAAGDIALYPDKLFGGVRRVDHWECAMAQGQVAGANITGKKRQRFEFVPRYSTKVFDLKFDFFGDLSRPPSRYDLAQGGHERKQFVIRYYQGNFLTAIVLCNQDAKRIELAEKEMRSVQR